MADLILSGHVVDLIVAFVVVEALLLGAYRWRTGRGLAPPDVLAMLLPGVFLLLSLRAALVGDHWGWIAAFLLLSLLCHLSDLRRRLG